MMKRLYIDGNVHTLMEREIDENSDIDGSIVSLLVAGGFYSATTVQTGPL